MAPLLSIVIPTYNRGFFLEQLLFSIDHYARAEEIPKDLLEVVVVDNASTDGTPAICQDYSTRIARFRSVRRTELVAAEVNIISSSLVATGEWVWTFGDDDIIHAGSLKKIINLLHHLSADIVFLNYSSVWKNGTTRHLERLSNLESTSTPIPLGNLITQRYFFQIISFISASVCRRACLAAVDYAPYQTGFVPAYSHVLVKLEAFAKRPALFIAEPLLAQRLDNTRVNLEADVRTVSSGITFFKGCLSLIERGCVDANELWAMSAGEPGMQPVFVHDMLAGHFFGNRRFAPGSNNFETVQRFLLDEGEHLPHSVQRWLRLLLGGK
ncbi:MAG: glycosyltransferase [Magnetococcus sp. MYC-9]